MKVAVKLNRLVRTKVILHLGADAFEDIEEAKPRVEPTSPTVSHLSAREVAAVFRSLNLVVTLEKLPHVSARYVSRRGPILELGAHFEKDSGTWTVRLMKMRGDFPIVPPVWSRKGIMTAQDLVELGQLVAETVQTLADGSDSPEPAQA